MAIYAEMVTAIITMVHIYILCVVLFILDTRRRFLVLDMLKNANKVALNQIS